MLLPISICGRKMSVFRYFIPENAILQQIDVSIERLLADFRWQSIDFVDALKFAKGKLSVQPGRVCEHGWHQIRRAEADDFF